MSGPTGPLYRQQRKCILCSPIGLIIPLSILPHLYLGGLIPLPKKIPMPVS